MAFIFLANAFMIMPGLWPQGKWRSSIEWAAAADSDAASIAFDTKGIKELPGSINPRGRTMWGNHHSNNASSICSYNIEAFKRTFMMELLTHIEKATKQQMLCISQRLTNRPDWIVASSNCVVVYVVVTVVAAVVGVLTVVVVAIVFMCLCTELYAFVHVSN